MGNLITEIYLDKNKRLIEFLKLFKYYGITTDGWSSEAKKKACISLTIHFLDKVFELKKISLGVIAADYEHNADNLADHLNKVLSSYGILDKVSVICVDHASTMGKMCKNLDRDFHGCLNHLLNLICKLFFDCVNKCTPGIEISDDEEEEKNEEENASTQQLKDTLLSSQALPLSTIEEETENELAQESSSFDSDGFNEIATNIVTLLGKIKKVVGLFNQSNDLTRDLTAAQKECNQAEELLMDKPYLSTNITSTNILRVIQDIITRYLFL
jgi:ElaB/YqjD/DUF883 family membrane-anchored ribosome-binding protein